MDSGAVTSTSEAPSVVQAQRREYAKILPSTSVCPSRRKLQPPAVSRAARKSTGAWSSSFSLPPQAHSRQSSIVSTASIATRRTETHPYFKNSGRQAIISVGVIPYSP